MVNLAADSWTKYCNFNLKSRKNSCPNPTFPFPGGVMGNIFLENSSGSPNFAPRDGPPEHKVKCVSVLLQKSTLRIKIQCCFFLWRYMNASPFEISKKLLKFILVFDL